MLNECASESGTIKCDCRIFVFPAKYTYPPLDRMGDSERAAVVRDKQSGCGRVHLIACVVARISAVTVRIIAMASARHWVVAWVAGVAHADAEEPVLSADDEERGNGPCGCRVVVASRTALVVAVRNNGVIIAVVGCPRCHG